MAEDSDKLTALSRLKDCTDLADFIITADGRTWNVHRLVLSMHSDVLKQMCSSEFKEANARKLDWSEYHEDVIQAFCDYLYRWDYETHGYGSWFSCGLVFHVHMAVIADKYNISVLYALANQKFKSLLEIEYSEEELGDAIAVAYECALATKEIRQVIARHIVNDKPGGIPEALRSAMRQHSDFAADIADLLHLKLQPTSSESKQKLSSTYRCDCSHEFSTKRFWGDPHISCNACGFSRRQDLWKPILKPSGETGGW